MFHLEDDAVIFTCLKVTGHYEKKKLGAKLKDESRDYREISENQLNKYAQAYKDFYVNQHQYELYRSFIEDIFHDIRKFNRDIKYKNERIMRKAQQGKKYAEFLDLSKNIQAMCWFMSIRLNNHDFTYNMELMDKDVKSTYNIHKIIYKVKECMKERANDKNVKIRLSAEQEMRDIKAYECIELLPYLFLDNAIKYSLAGTEIQIVVEQKGERQHVKFESIGPMTDVEEQGNIIKQNVRGKYAEKIADGMGIGLYTAKCICDLNEIELEVRSDDNIVKVKDDVPYSKFCVDFYLQL